MKFWSTFDWSIGATWQVTTAVKIEKGFNLIMDLTTQELPLKDPHDKNKKLKKIIKKLQDHSPCDAMWA